VVTLVLGRHEPGAYLLRARSDGRMGLALAVRRAATVSHYLIADNGRNTAFHLVSSSNPAMPTFPSLKVRRRWQWRGPTLGRALTDKVGRDADGTPAWPARRWWSIIGTTRSAINACFPPWMCWNAIRP
jgi:hypothetical protein